MPDSILLTTYQYDDAGELSGTIDPQGTLELRKSDAAGRTIQQVHNAGSFTQLGTEGDISVTEDNQFLYEDP